MTCASCFFVPAVTLWPPEVVRGQVRRAEGLGGGAQDLHQGRNWRMKAMKPMKPTSPKNWHKTHEMNMMNGDCVCVDCSVVHTMHMLTSKSVNGFFIQRQWRIGCWKPGQNGLEKPQGPLQEIRGACSSCSSCSTWTVGLVGLVRLVGYLMDFSP